MHWDVPNAEEIFMNPVNIDSTTNKNPMQHPQERIPLLRTSYCNTNTVLTSTATLRLTPQVDQSAINIQIHNPVTDALHPDMTVHQDTPT